MLNRIKCWFNGHSLTKHTYNIPNYNYAEYECCCGKIKRIDENNLTKEEKLAKQRSNKIKNILNNL
jgi:hypothetical protein